MDDGIIGIGADEMIRGQRIQGREMVLHHLPDAIGDGDSVTVQVHDECRGYVGLPADFDGRTDGLSGEDVRAEVRRRVSEMGFWSYPLMKQLMQSPMDRRE